MLNSEIQNSINMLITPILQKDKFCLIDTSVCLQGKRWILRLLIDKINGGITLDECTRLNEKIADIIEREGIIRQTYILEVSSPGIDRPLRTYEDFSRCLNRKVRIYLSQCQEGKYEISGVVTSVTDKGIDLDSGGQIRIRHIPFEQIRKAKQVI